MKKKLFLTSIIILVLITFITIIASMNNFKIEYRPFKNEGFYTEQKDKKEIIKVTNSDFVKADFVAPTFVNEDILAFQFDTSEEFKSHIGVIYRKNNNYERIYTTEKGKIINSLVGSKNKIFWVENDRFFNNDLNWKIKSMNLTTKEISEVRSGITSDQILPPVLTIYNNKITWIEKIIENNIIYSTAILYNPENGALKEIFSVELDETTTRDGIFMVIQKPIENGVIIQQTVFASDSDEIDKSVELMYYPYNSTKSTLLKKGEGVIDFTANENWFVWSEIGKINIKNRKTDKIEYVINGLDPDLTLDSLFIIGDVLYYRYSMHQIFQVNLKTGDIKEVTPSRLVTSKIFYSDNYLSFSHIDVKKNNGEVEFTILSID